MNERMCSTKELKYLVWVLSEGGIFLVHLLAKLVFKDTAGPSQSSSHESGRFWALPTGDEGSNAMTISLDSVREIVRDELH